MEFGLPRTREQRWPRPEFTNSTMFKDTFKYYKSRVPPPSYEDVIDSNSPNFDRVKRTEVANRGEEFVPHERLGLRSPDSWETFEFKDVPGLVLVKNPFTASGQRFWITKCLRDYSRKPNRLNLDAHSLLGRRENWWDICNAETTRAKELESKLRWATLGYHHDWHLKVYSEASKDDMPFELSELTATLAAVLGFEKFRAEAAIVNYYRMNSTLSGHTDHSEADLGAPLLSISFGQTAIFLVGGTSQEEPALAMFLRSGDVLVMAGESRRRYHGVPRILPAETTPWRSREDESGEDGEWSRAENYISQARINLNVRQVLREGQVEL